MLAMPSKKCALGAYVDVQSDQSLHCPLPESLDTIECIN